MHRNIAYNSAAFQVAPKYFKAFFGVRAGRSLRATLYLFALLSVRLRLLMSFVKAVKLCVIQDGGADNEMMQATCLRN